MGQNGVASVEFGRERKAKAAGSEQLLLKFKESRR
jgi:hypothetical protein